MATCLAAGETIQLPPPTQSIKSSALFLKKVTGLAISSIAYCRNLFSERAFIDKEFNGTRIKVLRSVSKKSTPTGAAQCLARWIEGAFDALEKKYLRTLVLEIREGDGSKHLLETYSFRYTYKDNETECTVKGEQNGSSSEIEVQTLSEVQQLLRHIFIMCSTEETLPLNCVTTMRIEYYDEVTPPEYEPPGFKPFLENMPAFKGESKSIRCHQISTPYHGMIVSTRQPTKRNEEESSIQSASAVKEKLQTDRVVQGNRVVQEVQCLCGKTEVSSQMLKCCKCNMYQHAACNRIAVVSSLPLQHQEHICRKCSGMNNSDNEEPEKCLYRRFLAECSLNKSVTLNGLMQELHLDCEKTILFMKQLIRDEVLLKSSQPLPTADKPHLAFNVDKDNLKKKVMPKYFDSQEWTEQDGGNEEKKKASKVEDQVVRVQPHRKKLSTKKSN